MRFSCSIFAAVLLCAPRGHALFHPGQMWPFRWKTALPPSSTPPLVAPAELTAAVEPPPVLSQTLPASMPDTSSLPSATISATFTAPSPTPTEAPQKVYNESQLLSKIPDYSATIPKCQSRTYDFSLLRDRLRFRVDAAFEGHVEFQDGLLKVWMHPGAGSIFKHHTNYWTGTRFSAVMAAPQVAGTITTFIARDPLQVHGGDEIDVEIMGKTSNAFQTNLFAHGNETNGPIYGTYGDQHYVPTNISAFNTYSLEYNKTTVEWFENGQSVRKSTMASMWNSEHSVAIFPTGPLHAEGGIWGPLDKTADNESWAGKAVDWMLYPKGLAVAFRKISIECMGGEGVWLR